MSDTVIRVENLSKKYVLGSNGHADGLRHVIHDYATAPLRWLRSRSGRPGSPAAQNGSSSETRKPEKDLWALNDVSFEVKQGDLVGIIGRNGSGKSTVLKILSRITEPTEGRVEITGRVASLLEVGTGFHLELTGRENIYLNGAILGMSRSEIKKRFDEIVAFAEVDRFLDTPVKRYSSGMYVRLAFAVAAHLEPDIMIVDEVLAVGDAQFQKKCLGKMRSVSEQEGRTVLLVSHNMATIAQLTQSAFCLQNGRIAYEGATDMVVQKYTECTDAGSSVFFDVEHSARKWSGTNEARILSLRFHRAAPKFSFGENFTFIARVRAFENIDRIRFSIVISTAEGMPVGGSFSSDHPGLRCGETSEIMLILPKPHLGPGFYYCAVALGKGDHKTSTLDYDVVVDTLQFEVLPQENNDGTVALWPRGWGPVIFQELEQQRLGHR